MLIINATLFDLVKGRYIDTDEAFTLLTVANHLQHSNEPLNNLELQQILGWGKNKVADTTQSLQKKGLVIKTLTKQGRLFAGNVYQLTPDAQKLITPEAFNGELNTNK